MSSALTPVMRSSRAAASLGAAAVSTWACTTSGWLCEDRSKTGAKARHGPHHDAQKSIRTMELSAIVVSESAAVRLLIVIARSFRCVAAELLDQSLEHEIPVHERQPVLLQVPVRVVRLGRVEQGERRLQ